MQLQIDVKQRRETLTVGTEYRFYVTTVISSVKDLDAGGAVIATSPIPYYNLFVVDARAFPTHGTADLMSDPAMKYSRVATPEDFSEVPPSMGAGIPLYPDLPRLFFPSEANPDPTDPVSSIAPNTITLGSIYVPVTARPNTASMYVSNTRIQYTDTLADADALAAETLNAVKVFVRRFNEIAAGFSTLDDGLPGGYESFTT